MREYRLRQRERAQQEAAIDEEMEEDDEDEPETSSDPLGRWDTEAAALCDALCTEALLTLSEDTAAGNDLYSMQEALEYAFNARALSAHPSEPNQ